MRDLTWRRPDETGYDTDDHSIRTITRELCKPCEYWFEDSVPIDEMFPLELLPLSEKATCFGLQLKNGAVKHGAYWRRLSNQPPRRD